MTQITVRAIREDRPGPRWQSLHRRFWPAYREWTESRGAGEVSAETAEARLAARMPELQPIYRRLVDLAGGDAEARRFLTLYRPAPYVMGCSQVVWTGEEPALIRNYDYSPRRFEGVVLATAWSGRRVIAMSDCLWGALDGINEDGLAVALAFGGSRTVGDGFGCPLILRYVLETCTTVREAAAALAKIPTHMAYNVTAVDASGDFVTAYMGPDQPAVLRRWPLATNHQENGDWPEYVEATSSVERERFLAARLSRPDETLEHLAACFLEPPLYNQRYDIALGTLYTAVYRPRARSVEFLWREARMTQSFEGFKEEEIAVRLSGSRPSSG